MRTWDQEMTDSSLNNSQLPVLELNLAIPFWLVLCLLSKYQNKNHLKYEHMWTSLVKVTSKHNECALANLGKHRSFCQAILLQDLDGTLDFKPFMLEQFLPNRNLPLLNWIGKFLPSSQDDWNEILHLELTGIGDLCFKMPPG